MYKGWTQLTSSDRKHLKKVAGVVTTYDLEHNFAAQAELRKLGGSEPCWDCRRIAEKLGYTI